jgi:hypothetical protein
MERGRERRALKEAAMQIIMCARTYPAYHPKAGQPTGFRKAILEGRKVHTLRRSAGGRHSGAQVSLREWSGRPYASRQVEFARCGILIEPLTIAGLPWWHSSIVNLAHCDGFDDPRDFAAWFRAQPAGPVHFTGVCIFFDSLQPIHQPGKDTPC